jgi:hypothetical protein
MRRNPKPPQVKPILEKYKKVLYIKIAAYILSKIKGVFGL